MDSVIKYAKNAKAAGLDGVVCSVHEAKAIHEACGDDFLTVTPGIRLASDSKDDQNVLRHQIMLMNKVVTILL